MKFPESLGVLTPFEYTDGHPCSGGSQFADAQCLVCTNLSLEKHIESIYIAKWSPELQ
jgi:hypothetical protein